MLQNHQRSQRVKVVPGIVNVIAVTKDQTVTVNTSKENQPLVIDLPAEMPTPVECEDLIVESYGNSVGPQYDPVLSMPYNPSLNYLSKKTSLS